MFQIQPFSQQDPHWNNMRLGLDPGSTIGSYGCLLTCLAMVVDGFGASETPATLNEKMKAVGGFQGAWVMPAVISKAVPAARYQSCFYCEHQPAPMAEIDNHLAAGLPVIVRVDYSPKEGLQDHWIVLVEKRAGDYLLVDPWPYPCDPDPLLLGHSRFAFAGSPDQIITAVLYLEGQAQEPAPLPPPQPAPAEGWAVYSQVDGLALRQQPLVTGDNVIKRLPLLGKVYVQEPEEQARQKLGVLNQWLQVQDAAEGYLGYVAAWYVAEAAPATPEPPPGPTPALQPFPPETGPTPEAVLPGAIAYTTIAGLALRSEPTLSSQTLLKRLPLNAQILILDSGPEAQAKIGASGQWLRVRDVEGEEGFVSSGYLALSRPPDSLGVQTSPAASPITGTGNEKLVLRVGQDNLALRQEPRISATNLIKRLPFGAELLVIEPPGEAAHKVGIQNQWIQVRDIEGAEGYAAAWYLMTRPAQAI